jgi:hypothetical protein
MLSQILRRLNAQIESRELFWEEQDREAQRRRDEFLQEMMENYQKRLQEYERLPRWRRWRHDKPLKPRLAGDEFEVHDRDLDLARLRELASLIQAGMRSPEGSYISMSLRQHQLMLDYSRD